MNRQVAYRKPRDPGYIGGYYWPPSIAGFVSLMVVAVVLVVWRTSQLRTQFPQAF